MLITIFGATGMVGKELVKQALYRGYRVRAFGRNVFTAGLPDDDRLELYKGALFDENQVAEAVSGASAVLSAIGGSFDGSDKARSLGMRNIVEQMKKKGPARIVAVGGKGLLQNEEGKFLMDLPSYPEVYIPVGLEHKKALEFLEASGLDWTFVCAPNIIPADATGEIHHAANVPPEPDNHRINSGDLAMFMLNELEKKQYIKSTVGISN